LRKAPFLRKDYTYNEEKGKYTPFLEVLVGTRDSKKPVIALVDTGCSPCMSLCKSYIDEQGLTFIQKMNKEPIPVGVADGHTINADSYKAICQINGEEKEIEICVIDPEKFFEEEEPEIGTVAPLLGRGILDGYDVLFEGKNRKLTLFHPE
jgi:predicted aspartyl protease